MNIITKPVSAAILMLVSRYANGQLFEVASIHRYVRSSHDTSLNILPGGRISATSTTLKTLIRYAYKIQSFQLAATLKEIAACEVSARKGDR